MLTANLVKAKGFRAAATFEVTASGTPIAILNEPKFTFDHDGASYSISRGGALFPIYQLKCGEMELATATQAPLVHKYTVVAADKEWVLKAEGILANKYGLFRDEREIGTITPGAFLSRCKGITVDLPDDIPLPVQLFLLLIVIRQWSDSGN